MKRPPQLKLTAPVPLEHQLHEQITDALRVEIGREGHCSALGVMWFSYDPSHYAGVPGTRVARGVAAGIPDMVVLHDERAYWIEIKRPELGVLSDPQRQVCVGVLATKGRYAVCTDYQHVLRVLDKWGIPRSGRLVPQRAA